MKNKDLLVLGVVGLLAFMLLKPAKTVAADGSKGTSVSLGMPSINLPNFSFEMPSINLPANIPDITEITIPNLIPDVTETGLTPEDIINIITDTITDVGGIGTGITDDIIETVITDKGGSDSPSILEGYRDIGGGIFDTIRDIAFTVIPSPFRDMFTRPKGNWYDDWLEIKEQSEATFAEAGIVEATTIEDIQALKAASIKLGYSSGNDDMPALGSPEYLSYALGYGKRGIPSYAELEAAGEL